MDPSDPHRSSMSGVSASSKKKAPMCREFGRGNCRYGESCKFAHTDRRNILDQRRSGGGGVDKNQNVVNVSLPRRGICRFFNSNGHCQFGNNCKFEHQVKSEENQEIHREISAIRIQPTDVNVRTNPQFKRRLCQSWMNRNTCAFGANCIFAHGQADLVQSLSSTGSQSRNSLTAPGTQNKDVSPSNPGSQMVEQKEAEKMKWKIDKKRATIYGDWPGDLD